MEGEPTPDKAGTPANEAMIAEAEALGSAKGAEEADANKAANSEPDEHKSVSMPPPPRPPSSSMPPPPMPPPKKPTPAAAPQEPAPQAAAPQAAAPYKKPDWSGAPAKDEFPFMLEILKNGTIVDTVDIGGKEAVIIGRNADTCDIVLEHPSISRQHAVIQFKSDGAAYVFDMSTHGSRVNKKQLKSRVYAKLRI